MRALKECKKTMHSERKRTRCLTLPLGQWKDGKPPNSIFVVLGSARQKGVVFRSIAGNMKAKTTIVKMLRGVAVRDYFPKELIPDAQRLVQRGLMMKRNGQVVARGPGIIPSTGGPQHKYQWRPGWGGEVPVGAQMSRLHQLSEWKGVQEAAATGNDGQSCKLHIFDDCLCPVI